jgi:hypothetical protein
MCRVFGVVLRFFLLCLLCLSFGARIVAKDLSAYRVGEVADTDIITPVPLDVVDVAATAELKSAKAREYPAIFRGFAGATNLMVQDFLAAFEQGHARFLGDFTNAFHSPTPDQAVIASPDFGRLVTVFGMENRDFPITEELAGEWARGWDGQVIQAKLLAVLQWAAGRQIRPDVLPEDLAVGELVRLVAVTEPDQKLAFETVQQGQLIPAASLITVSNAQALFRREFPAREQLFARALAGLIRPNCLPDDPLTKLTRGTAVCQLVVSDHFDAGDTIVRQGDTVSAKTHAALLALSAALQSKPPVAPVVVTAVKAQPPRLQEAPLRSTVAAPVPKAIPAPAVARPNVSAEARVPGQMAARRHVGLIVTLGSISLGALLVAVWQFLRERKRRAGPLVAAQAPLPLALPGTVKADLTPQVTQAVREAVQQELAAQRRELLLAQQAATEEIAALVRRLDELQVPMQQRLQTYENRIHTLEQELALRNEENRELLRLKIEMISRQMESERSTNVVSTVTASS